MAKLTDLSTGRRPALLAIFGFHLYREFAKTKGIPLLLDDATAAQLVQLLQQIGQPSSQSPARS